MSLSNSLSNNLKVGDWVSWNPEEPIKPGDSFVELGKAYLVTGLDSDGDPIVEVPWDPDPGVSWKRGVWVHNKKQYIHEFIKKL